MLDDVPRHKNVVGRMRGVKGGAHDHLSFHTLILVIRLKIRSTRELYNSTASECRLGNESAVGDAGNSYISLKSQLPGDAEDGRYARDAHVHLGIESVVRGMRLWMRKFLSGVSWWYEACGG